MMVTEMDDPQTIQQSIHPLLTYLQQIHEKYADCDEGQVADYIPELGKANPKWFGISIATIDGHVYEVGETNQQFTIQSISKPFVYGLALQDRGLANVCDKVGVEPSGDAFNSISLQSDTGRPFNPMINAGAIGSTGLIAGDHFDHKYHRLLEMFGEYFGRTVEIDEQVYRSESETGDRNRAIGYMLRNAQMMDERPEEVLDLYFRQCSVLVNCRDLAVMAATLANAGISPVTGRTVLEQWCVPRVLGVMSTCGMYDYSGEWIYRVGLPSKSGVGGGIIGVLPGHLGISVFSPPLDARGNSVRGIKVFSDLSEYFDLHLFNVTRSTRTVVRSRYDGSKVGSKRVRCSSEAQFLAEEGKRIVTYELQGELTLSSVEMVIRDVMQLSLDVKYVIFDFKRILAADRPALELFAEFRNNNQQRFDDFILTNISANAEIQTFVDSLGFSDQFRICTDNDTAIEFCENRLLEESPDHFPTGEEVPLEKFDFFKGLHSEEIKTVERYLQREIYNDQQQIIRQGDDPDSIYLLTKGQASVTITREDGSLKRLATCSPGMAFGEMAIIEKRPRSADVRADGPVECYIFPLADFEQISRTYPTIKFTILENIARGLSERVRRLTDEVRTLQ